MSGPFGQIHHPDTLIVVPVHRYHVHAREHRVGPIVTHALAGVAPEPRAR